MELGIDVHGRHGSALLNAAAEGFGVFAVEGFAVGDHFVKQRTEAEDVGAGVERLSLDLLGRHVVLDRRRLGRFRREFADAGKAEAEDANGAIPPAHNFGGLQAVVKNVLRVGVIEGAAHLAADIEQVPDGKTFFIGQHGGDAIALDVFHCAAELAVDFSGAEDGREIGVGEDFCGLDLIAETFSSAAAWDPKAES